MTAEAPSRTEREVDAVRQFYIAKNSASREFVIKSSTETIKAKSFAMADALLAADAARAAAIEAQRRAVMFNVGNVQKEAPFNSARWSIYERLHPLGGRVERRHVVKCIVI